MEKNLENFLNRINEIVMYPRCKEDDKLKFWEDRYIELDRLMHKYEAYPMKVKPNKILNEYLGVESIPDVYRLHRLISEARVKIDLYRWGDSRW